MHRTLHVTGLVAAGLLTACARSADSAETGQAAATPATFTPVQVVSQATANGATPMFLVTPQGDRVLSWVSAPEGGHAGQLNIAVSPAAGGPPVLAAVTDPLGGIEPHGEAPPQLAANGRGGLYALYAVGKEIPGARFPVSSLRLVRSDDGGRQWSSPVTVNTMGQLGEFGSHNFSALGVGPDGTLWATWLENVRGRSGVWFTRSTDGGRTWSEHRALNADEACPCCRTAIVAGPDGDLYVAWRSVASGDVRDIVVAHSPDNGATWDAPVKPRQEGWVFAGCPHAGPSMKVDAAGRVHISWWTGKAGEAGVWYAISADKGKTWQAQAMATAERSVPAHVQMALAGDRKVIVAWDDGLSETPRILLRRSADGGRTFSAVERVSGEGAAQYPVVATVGDSVLVAWKQQTLAAHREELAARVDMKDPKAVMRLPRVGQAEIYLRRSAL